MGARTWAAFGNVLKILSLPLFLGSAVSAYGVFELAQAGAPIGLLTLAAALAIIGFGIAALFWMAKGPLVSGNIVAQFLVGLYMLLWVVSSLGLALIFIGIVYLFTSEPDTVSVFRDGKAAKPKPRLVPPADWTATGRVGPSGATLYTDLDREELAGIFSSWTPVQVMDKRDGYAKVVAATGEGGWIDQRTLAEGV